MTVHHLKTLPSFFAAVRTGQKSFELRLDDRDPPFAAGDVLALQEWNPVSEERTGAEIRRRVTAVYRADDLPGGLKRGYALMCIEPMFFLAKGALGKEVKNG